MTTQMDKGHLSAEKFMTTQTVVAVDEACSKDSVVATASKKEKSNQFSDAGDVAPSQTKTQTTSRGKDVSEKKPEVKLLTEFPSDTEELLGSVTTYNCHGTRTSARVIQKMRQDQQTRPTTPPPTERETGRKEERSTTQKTPSQVRANRPTWSNVERNHFFDALNEFGKDFEAIGNFINAKLKRRSPTIDVSFKSKDQVRQHYYQTYHKICKYVRFSEEVRKPVQEMYALVNYGEMRRKLQFVTDKHFMKLRKLVYHGHVTVRCKGKNIRIKTPSCKALRRLNQLDDSLEDIRLPSKIEVIISPANMEAFGRVQTIAQNPRCRTVVPLHKKLTNFISIFQYKWRSMDVRVAEEAKRMSATENQNQQASNDSHQMQDPEICFLPKHGVLIHRPLLSITEYLSSVNICLTAYEERMGMTIRGEMLNIERNTGASSTCSSSTVGQSSTTSTTSNKRSRTESGSEKKLPEQTKRAKAFDVCFETPATTDETVAVPSTELETFSNIKHDSGDELSDEIHELLSDSLEVNNSKEELTLQYKNPTQSTSSILTNSTPAEMSTSTTAQVPSVRSKAARSMNSKATRSVFKPLLNDETIQRIRSGWTASTAGDITVGDLYVVLGHDSKLELDYYWLPQNKSNKPAATSSVPHQTAMRNDSQASEKGEESNEAATLSNKLKQLLLIANLSERMRKRPCNCERNLTIKARYDRDYVAARTFVANKTYANSGVAEGNAVPGGSGLFRQPMIPVRRTPIDPVKQLTTLTRQKMSRQILVQRLLLPSNGNVSSTSRTTCNNVTPAMTSDIPSKKTSIVPWNASTCKTTNTDSIVSSNDANDSQDLSTFLNSLTSEETTHVTQPQTSHYPQPQYIMDDLSDKSDQGPSSVRSIDSAFDETSNTSFLNGLSPMNLLRESTSNSRWIEDNINDFSLTSLLGHLDEINGSRDILDQSSNISIISESSVDYMHKFQEIKALLQSQEKD